MFKLGVVGLSRIATTKVIPSILVDPEFEITAIATRSKKISEINWIKNATIYHDYYDILNNNELDGLYVSLPNSMHADYSLLCIRKGQNALIEKPLFLSSKEASCVINYYDRKTIIKEGFMYKHHPQWLKIISLLHDRTIGNPISVDINISYICHDTNNIRYNKKLGGGALYDVGIYCFSMARLIFNQEPLNAHGKQIISKNHDVDITNEGIIEFNNGKVTFKASIISDRINMVKIQCENGEIELQEALNPKLDEAAIVKIKKDGRVIKHITNQSNQFKNQLIAFKNNCRQSIFTQDIIDSANNIKALEMFISKSEKEYVTC